MSADPLPRVCRFRADASPESPSYSPLPDDGFCISLYVLLRSPRDGTGVVAGRLDPGADWPSIGAIPAERLERLSKGWMLPSRHLRLFEDPDTAARSILSEQLGLSGIALRGPRIFSETYRREGTGRDPHWDLQLIYEGSWPMGRPLAAAPWRTLELLDLSTTPAESFVRSHADILALAGSPATGR
ncbi:MAG TPA: hypothetical protein VEY07_04435 [Thermoplasmata archaeon]|nr:hypothetical protein [Thermoplasmata archaeon]